jgi:hypothetical protein
VDIIADSKPDEHARPYPREERDPGHPRCVYPLLIQLAAGEAPAPMDAALRNIPRSHSDCRERAIGDLGHMSKSPLALEAVRSNALRQSVVFNY